MASDGSALSSSFTLTEGQTTVFDIAASVNGRINPDNVEIEFIEFQQDFKSRLLVVLRSLKQAEF